MPKWRKIQKGLLPLFVALYLVILLFDTVAVSQSFFSGWSVPKCYLPFYYVGFSSGRPVFHFDKPPNVLQSETCHGVKGIDQAGQTIILSEKSHCDFSKATIFDPPLRRYIHKIYVDATRSSFQNGFAQNKTVSTLLARVGHFYCHSRNFEHLNF